MICIVCFIIFYLEQRVEKVKYNYISIAIVCQKKERKKENSLVVNISLVFTEFRVFIYYRLILLLYLFILSEYWTVIIDRNKIILLHIYLFFLLFPLPKAVLLSQLLLNNLSIDVRVSYGALSLNIQFNDRVTHGPMLVDCGFWILL